MKPTNNFHYLHRNSAHSPSVFRGFMKGECIRQLRNTSDHALLTSNLSQFKCHLLKRGYKQTEVDPIIRSTLSMERSSVLQHKIKGDNSEIPLVMITKYDPRVKGLKRRLTKHWKIIKNDEYCRSIFNQVPIIAYKKHRNITDLVISSRIKN